MIDIEPKEILKRWKQRIQSKFDEFTANLVGVKVYKNTHHRKLEKLKLRFNKNINIFIGDKLTKDIERLFFCKEPRVDDGSITLHYKGDPYLSAIMRDIGLFNSISDAKGAGWHRKADFGFFHDIITIKRVPHNITIYKEDNRKLDENQPNETL